MATSDKFVKMGWFVFFLVVAFVLLVILLLAQYFHQGSAHSSIRVGMSHGEVNRVLWLFAEKRALPAEYPASVHVTEGITVYKYDMPYDGSSDTLIWVVYDSRGRVMRTWTSD